MTTLGHCAISQHQQRPKARSRPWRIFFSSPLSSVRKTTSETWSARRFVDNGEKPEFIRTREEEVCIMPASKHSPEFKEHVVVEVLEASRPITDSSEALRRGAEKSLNNWTNKHRKKHPDPQTEGESSGRIAENKRLKTELREARMGIDF